MRPIRQALVPASKDVSTCRFWHRRLVPRGNSAKSGNSPLQDSATIGNSRKNRGKEDSCQKQESITGKKSPKLPNQDRIEKIAWQVRKHIEQPNCQCLRASTLIATRLAEIGLQPVIVEGLFITDRNLLPRSSNFWVVCSSLLIDVTADQFNPFLEKDRFPKVVCIPVEQASNRYSQVNGRKH